MRIKIIERRKVLRDFNRFNCTTNPISSYIGVRVVPHPLGDQLLFSHANGVGRKYYDGPQLRGTSVDESYLD